MDPCLIRFRAQPPRVRKGESMDRWRVASMHMLTRMHTNLRHFPVSEFSWTCFEMRNKQLALKEEVNSSQFTSVEKSAVCPECD